VQVRETKRRETDREQMKEKRHTSGLNGIRAIDGQSNRSDLGQNQRHKEQKHLKFHGGF
jgi:hypothetical protein